MIFLLNLNQIRKITDATLLNINDDILNAQVKGINTDSRNLHSQEVFVALQGDKFDGHDFLEKAVSQGAIAAITNQNHRLSSLQNIPQLRVVNTLEAYQQISHYWRNQFSIPLIAVTGSVGKTTTKELIAAVLATQGKVLKTEANYNNEIGVPKTLLNLENNHQYAVIEMAMRGKGEISLLTEIANPNIAVITNVGTAHIGRLGSREAIAYAKCELLEKMDSSGVAILNHDCPLLLETASKVWSGKTITYGLEGGDLQGKIIDSKTIKIDNKIFPLPLKGRHNALNYLAAIAVAKLLKIDLNLLEKPVTINLPEGRSHYYKLAGNVEILDETYNAGLESMLASLQLLKDHPGQRKIAVLGTMKELGKYSSQLHYQVGETVKKLGINCLFVLVNEPEAEDIVKGAFGVYTEICDGHEDLLSKLLEKVKPGDRLLFKASHSVGLSQVVKDFRNLWHDN
jgi:UDP-N-acetylmuramoyl-tripeptide--D-alanyl-D-alanine ligase